MKKTPDDLGYAHGNNKSVKDNPKTIADMIDVIGEENARPMEIVDQMAYESYMRIQAHPLLNENKMQTASDGSIINLARLSHHIQKDVEHLPTKEQQKFMTLKKAYHNLHNKKHGAYRKAYGTSTIAKAQGTSKHRGVLDLRRPELIELFGKMFSLSEVHEIVLSQWKMSNVTKETLREWRVDNANDINVRMEQHKREYSDIRLAHKRSRLEEYVWLYQKRKRIYESSKKGEDHRLLLSTLEAIKKECEGDLIRVEGVLELTGEDVREQLKETFSFISLKEIIIARVAAKAGLDVAKIVTSISQGYYSHIIHEPEGDEFEMPAFPSSSTYDFERIGAKHAQEKHNAEAAALVKVLPLITTEDKSKAVDIKALLISKLKGRQGDVNLVKNNLTMQAPD